MCSLGLFSGCPFRRHNGHWIVTNKQFPMFYTPNIFDFHRVDSFGVKWGAPYPSSPTPKGLQNEDALGLGLDVRRQNTYIELMDKVSSTEIATREP